MLKSKQIHKMNLIVVAHPDDESIFFGGLVLGHKSEKYHIVCVTDGNADGQKLKRYKQFKNAAKKLGAHGVTFLDLPDIYSRRLDLDLLQAKLKPFENVGAVYTHGPTGEYGHPHHQDVSYAVHKFFHKKCAVYSVAYNCAPDIVITLNKKLFIKKAQILSQIYFSETERFINILPATFTEGFCRLETKEVESIYKFFCSSKNSAPTYLNKYKWLKPYFKSLKARAKKRMF